MLLYILYYIILYYIIPIYFVPSDLVQNFKSRL